MKGMGLFCGLFFQFLKSIWLLWIQILFISEGSREANFLEGGGCEGVKGFIQEAERKLFFEFYLDKVQGLRMVHFLVYADSCFGFHLQYAKPNSHIRHTGCMGVSHGGMVNDIA